MNPRTEPTRTWSLACLLGLAALARAGALVFSYGASYDLASYHLVAQHFLRTGHLYDAATAGHYPYLPGWLFCLLPLYGLGHWLAIPEHIIFKLPACLADLGIVILLFFMLKRLNQERGESFFFSEAFWGALLYALQPLAVLISACHGQFDALPLFLMLLAAYFFEFSRHPHSDRYSALGLGAAIALKSWPLFFMPLFIKKIISPRERLVWAGWCLLPAASLGLVFWLRDGAGFTGAISHYFGAPGFSLLESLRALAYAMRLSPSSFHQVYVILRWVLLLPLAGLWVFYWLSSFSLPVLPGLALGSLTLYVFLPAYSAQYFLWLLPFGLFLSRRILLRHCLYGLAALLVFYLGFMPEALLNHSFSGGFQLPAVFFYVWAGLNFGLWFFWLYSWASSLAQYRHGSSAR